VQLWRTEDDQAWQSLYMLSSGLDVIGFRERGDA
jgi:hypothetical protein